VRKNYGTVNPAGRIVVNRSDIKNLYKKTDRWYDAIMTISLHDYAVANAYTLSPKESGKLVDSSGITATTTVNLPVATVGLDYRINRASSGTIRVKPNGSNKINGGAVGKYLSLDSQGALVHLFCELNGVWQVKSALGTNSFEP
jgi:hypothetical protein